MPFLILYDFCLNPVILQLTSWAVFALPWEKHIVLKNVQTKVLFLKGLHVLFVLVLFHIWDLLSSGFFSSKHKLIKLCAAAAAKSLQSCPTLCDPIDGSPPGSPVPGILQARTLEWVAISFSSAWKWKVKVKSLSRVRLLATPRTAAYQAPLSMGFSRQEYWSGVPLPSR